MNRSKSLGVAVASVLIGGGALALGGFALATATPHQNAAELRRKFDASAHVQPHPGNLPGLTARECTVRTADRTRTG